MSYAITIDLTVDAPAETEALLLTAAARALDQLDGRPGDTVSILLTGDDEVRLLNRRFRGEDRPTDVLSFPAGDMPPDPAEAEPARYLGDIAMALPTAERQAARHGHSVTEELQLLVVHGILHLLGFDHATAAEKEAMWSAQSHVLGSLGLTHVQPTEDESEH